MKLSRWFVSEALACRGSSASQMHHSDESFRWSAHLLGALSAFSALPMLVSMKSNASSFEPNDWIYFCFKF